MAKVNKLETMSSNTFDKVAWQVLLVISFIVPLLLSVIPMPWIAQRGIWFGADIYQSLKFYIFGIGVATIFASWCLSVGFKGRKIYYSPVLILLGLFIFWAFLSTLLSDYTAVSFFGYGARKEGLLSLTLCVLFMFLVMQYVRNKRDIKMLLTAVCASAAIVSLYGILQSFGFDVMTNQATFDASRSFSTLGNPDTLGGFLCMATFVSLGLALSEPERSYKTLYWGGFVLNIWCLTATFTRGAWLGFFAGLVFFIIWAMVKKVRFALTDWVGAVSALLVVAIVVIASFSSPIDDLNAKAKMADAVSSQSGNVSARFEFWKSASEAIGDAPILGRGLDTYALYSTEYMTPKAAKLLAPGVYVDTPHNYYLSTALGVGIVGLALLLGFFGWTAVLSAKTLKQMKTPTRDVTIITLWCSAVAFLAYGITGITVLGISFLFWMILGILIAPTAKPFEVGVSSLSKALSVGTVTICVFAALMFANMVYVDSLLGQALLFTGTAEKIAPAEQAYAVGGKKISHLEAFASLYSSYADVEASRYESGGRKDSAELERAAKGYERSIQYYDEILAKYPSYSLAFRGRAAAYNSLAELTGDTSWAEKALETAEVAEKIYPYDTTALLEKARAYLNLDEKDKGLEAIKKAKEFHPSDDQVKELESQLQGSEKAQ